MALNVAESEEAVSLAGAQSAREAVEVKEHKGTVDPCFLMKSLMDVWMET